VFSVNSVVESPIAKNSDAKQGNIGYSRGMSRQQRRRSLVRVGLVTDVHHSDADVHGTRYYRDSLAKMREAVDSMNRQRVDVALELGDLIDTPKPPDVTRERGFLKTITGEFGRLKAEQHYVLGNHCVTALTKEEFLQGCGQERSYYSFDKNGVHFVILDACFRRDGVPYQPGKFSWAEADIPPQERDWLQEDLKATDLPTLVFVHQRLDLWPSHVFAVKSCFAVRRILEESGKVLAVVQGHSHKNELVPIRGIPYITLGAMVEGPGLENNGYSVLRVYPNRTISLSGFRRHAEHPAAKKGALLPGSPEMTRKFPFPKPTPIPYFRKTA
jgi:predicted phosphodiesterase